MSEPSPDPIVLCHPACSGGSLIYKLLVAEFGLAGVTEVTHIDVWDPNAPAQLANPERSLLAGGFIDAAQFADLLIERLHRCEALCRADGRRLLIREHSHTRFFRSARPDETPGHPSWIASHWTPGGQPLPCIVTIRNPIDSWLGLANLSPFDVDSGFDAYCRNYLRFINSARAAGNVCRFVRYEDLVADPQGVLEEIASFLGIERADQQQSWSHIVSTGNSGRQSATIKPRPRRAFPLRLLRDAGESQAYEELAATLGYSRLAATVTAAQRVRGAFASIRSGLATAGYQVSKKVMQPMVNWMIRHRNRP